MNKPILKSLLILSASTLSIISVAQGNWQLGAKAGVQFPHIQSDEIDAGMHWPADEYTNDDINSSGVFSVSGGYTWVGGEAWFPFYSLLLNYTYASPVDVEGHVLQFGMPLFDNYLYEYSLKSQMLLAVGKVDLYRYHNLMPYVAVGIGCAEISFDSYNETPLFGITPRLSPDLDNKSGTNFSFQLAAGLDYIVLENLWLSVEYAYSHLGNAKSGESFAYSNDRLDAQLYSNSVTANLSYFFGTHS